MWWFLVIAAATFALGARRPVALDDTPPPRRLFFAAPDFTDPQLSPDGALLGFIAPRGDLPSLWVRLVEGSDESPVIIDPPKPVRWWRWVKNGRQVIYAVDEGGDENDRLFVASIDMDLRIRGDGTFQRVPVPGAPLGLTPAGTQARFVADDARRPDEIIIALNSIDPAAHDLWRVNTRTGALALLHRNDGGYVDFVLDADARLRAATRLNHDGGVRVDGFDAEGVGYELVRWDLDESSNSRPIGMTRDGRTMYITDSRATDCAGLYAFTTSAEGAMTYELIAARPNAEVAEVLVDPSSRRIQAVAFEHARREWEVIDPLMARDFESLRRLGEGDLFIDSRDDRDRHWIVRLERDAVPPEYFLYHRTSGTALSLGFERKDLAKRTLAPMRVVHIPARDGFTLISYLTSPPRAVGERVPMVLLVHGGPWSRDHWGFNETHQWLASRGYAVLSVNFRGSVGFGKRFTAAGNREWAAEMHDDLLDAALWAVERGVAHPDRIGIMGASYGGYAALVGLTFTPDYFACGVDIVGPSNLNTLLATIPRYWAPRLAMFEARIGPLDNPDFLASISPVHRADRIIRPLLIAHGANDPRVKLAESEQIAAAMRAAGIPLVFAVFPDEGHVLRKPANRLALHAVIESFLARHLGGWSEPFGNDLHGSSLEWRDGAEAIGGAGR
jgi:dipeptidyl aminopeptidase/acylaminoacyl peptidase